MTGRLRAGAWAKEEEREDEDDQHLGETKVKRHGSRVADLPRLGEGHAATLFTGVKPAIREDGIA